VSTLVPFRAGLGFDGCEALHSTTQNALATSKIITARNCFTKILFIMASNASPDHVAVDIPDEPIKEQSPHARNYEIVTQNQFFHQVVESAGRWAFGVIFVEVWVLNEAKTHLFRPEDGWWIDYYAHDCGGNSQFDRLIDPTRPDYIEPAPLAPGVGISGVLWAEVQGGNAANQNDHLERNVEWREIKPLSDDPDQPYNPRLKYLAEIGLGWAAGVPFKVGENQGIVVYMARESASVRKLTDSINENYLTHSTLLIGSAYSLGAPRLAAENARRTENHDTLKRVMNKIRALKAMNITLDVLVHEESQRPNKTEQQEGIGTDTVQGNACEDGFNYVVGKVRISVRKFFGANVKAPPKFTWEQTACTFFSALVTLAILTNINVALIKNYGESHSIVLG
jgi:hypothetical protein